MLKNNYMYIGLLIVLAISSFVFYDTFLFQVWQGDKTFVVSDVPVHAQFVVKFAESGHFPAYSLWYGLVYVFAGFSEKYGVIIFTSIILLTVLVAAKYTITYSIIKSSSADRKVVALVSVALIFIMPMISYYACGNGTVNKAFCFNDMHVYLGNIAPNQWHNSTLILAMPFNLLLFYFSVKNISAERLSVFFYIGILSVISILCKPNYVLAFLPVLCIAIFILNTKSQQYLRAILKVSIIAVPSMLTLIWQWYFTFMDNEALFANGAKTIIAPFFVWSNYTPHVGLSLLLSIAFPLLVLILYFNKIDVYLKMSWVTFLAALSIASTFAEYPNWGAGNYFWGAIAANYILFLYSIRFLLKQPICLKSKAAYLVFGTHLLSGFYLLASFFVRQTSLML